MSDSNDGPVRCPCGSKDELPKSQQGTGYESWIGCETCLAWQHSICVGCQEEVSTRPEKYYCEKCKPEHHRRFHFGSGPDNRYEIAKERQEMEAMLRPRNEDKMYKKTKWLITEIDAIAQGHPQAVTVEWAKLNGMHAEYQAAVSRVRKAQRPLAPWTREEFDHMVRLSIRIVLCNASVSSVERFRARLIKVRYEEAEAVAAELWSLRAWLNADFMRKMETESVELGRANVGAVRKFFNME
ncbi:hypothetical protein Q7P35_012345 [Cladosporium inversicolor]